MIDRVPASEAESGANNPGQKPGILSTIYTGTKNSAVGLMYGIPVELSFTGLVTSEIQNRVMQEYETRLESAPEKRIKNKVAAMLATLDAHFPHLEPNSMRWTQVRAHFFGKIKLWGKFG